MGGKIQSNPNTELTHLQLVSPVEPTPYPVSYSYLLHMAKACHPFPTTSDGFIFSIIPHPAKKDPRRDKSSCLYMTQPVSVCLTWRPICVPVIDPAIVYPIWEPYPYSEEQEWITWVRGKQFCDQPVLSFMLTPGAQWGISFPWTWTKSEDELFAKEN